MAKVVTKSTVRLSYVNLIAPRAQDDEKPDVLTYSSAILIPKKDKETIDAIKAAIKEALADGVARKWGGKRPSNLKNPLRDGDEDRADDENYAGHFFINGKGPMGGKEKPILMDKEGEPTSSASVIYSGVNARVSIQFYPYDKSGNRGVACGITSVMSMENGEPLGNVVTLDSARDEFGITTPSKAAKDEFSASADDKGESAESSSNDDDDDPWG